MGASSRSQLLGPLDGWRLRGELTGSRLVSATARTSGRFAPADRTIRKWFPRRPPADGRSLGMNDADSNHAPRWARRDGRAAMAPPRWPRRHGGEADGSATTGAGRDAPAVTGGAAARGRCAARGRWPRTQSQRARRRLARRCRGCPDPLAGAACVSPAWAAPLAAAPAAAGARSSSAVHSLAGPLLVIAGPPVVIAGPPVVTPGCAAAGRRNGTGCPACSGRSTAPGPEGRFDRLAPELMRQPTSLPADGCRGVPARTTGARCLRRIDRPAAPRARWTARPPGSPSCGRIRPRQPRARWISQRNPARGASGCGAGDGGAEAPPRRLTDGRRSHSE
jgi:hypothetical protein